jgi:hypothetical protein
VLGFTSVIVEKGVIVRDFKKTGRLRIVKGGGINHQ